MRKSALILGVLGLSLPAWLSSPAVADDGCRIKYQEKFNSRTGHHKYTYKEKCGRSGIRGSRYKRDWHRYKDRKHGYVIRKYKKRKRIWSGYYGGPPPWAPAHGYRAGYADIDIGTCYRGPGDTELLGGALGAVIGGLLGAEIGSDDGRLAATAAGTLLGALAGVSIVQSMDGADDECVVKALEASPDRRPVAWRNPDAGARYMVTPVTSYETAAGRYCREYITEATIGGRIEQVYGTACRRPDGAWEVVS